ncbi:MAG: ParD-like family protein [Methylobacter sp.]|nr:ParD-like family protein [Methylobacter sp.]
MKAAAVTGKRFHRSTAEQIEYWAEMGRSVETILDPDVLLALTAGVAKIKVEPVYSAPINPDEVFQGLEAERENGTLVQTVTNSPFKYQASLTHPGYLEQIDQNGKITPGKFQQGVFIAMTETDFER